MAKNEEPEKCEGKGVETARRAPKRVIVPRRPVIPICNFKLLNTKFGGDEARGAIFPMVSKKTRTKESFSKPTHHIKYNLPSAQKQPHKVWHWSTLSPISFYGVLVVTFA